MILVTGGTGLVGSHLLYKLVTENRKVRAIYRRKKTLSRVKHVFSYFSEDVDALFNTIEWVEADISNIPKLQLAFQDITQVYHCAAFISFEPDKYKALRKINIEGTANIVNLCLSENVEKLCYVSSVAAIGHHNNPERLINEETAWNPEDDNSVYAITKYGAELEVWRGTQEGLDAIVVNPGVILGPGFWHSGGSGSLFKKIHKGMSHFTKGVTGYIHVRDVVNCLTSLMESNIKNEGFILISKNMSFKDFQQKVANALGSKPPEKEAKPWLLGIAWRMDWLIFKLFGKRRQLSKQMAKSITTKTKYDNSKIKGFIDYNFKSIDDSIEDVSTLYLKDLNN